MYDFNLITEKRRDFIGIFFDTNNMTSREKVYDLS